MELEEAIEHALEGNAVLFVGAGFCVGAKNILNMDFLIGRTLSKHLCNKAGVTEDTDLNTAADMYLHKFGELSLISELQQQFSTKEVSSSHLVISKVNWRRIYTTNYDDILECAYSKTSKKLVPITTDDDPHEVASWGNACLHINGFVNRLSHATLFNSFKLTDTSYATESFARSGWGYIFGKDVRLARAVFFIGYSLHDLDIKRALYSEPKISDKLFFIVENNPSSVTEFQLSQFGQVVPIGVNGIAELLSEKLANWEPVEKCPIYTCFEEFNLAQGISKVQDKDIFDLYLYGEVNQNYICDSVGRRQDTDNNYYISRVVLDQAANEIRSGTSKNMLIESQLGNGKTLFIHGLMCILSSEGFNIFSLRDPTGNVNKEIEDICAIDNKVLVVVENYHRHLEILKYLGHNRRSNLALVLTSRNEIHDVYYLDLESALNTSAIREINIDKLQDIEIAKLAYVLSVHGLWGSHAAAPDHKQRELIKKKHRAEFQRVLLEVIESPDIKKRFEDLLQSINSNNKEGYSEALVLVCALKVINIDPSIHVIADLLGTDVLSQVHFRNDPVVRQLINIDAGTIGVRSAIFAKFLLASISDSTMVVDVLIRATKRATELGRLEAFYRSVFREMMRYSNLATMLSKGNQKHAVMTGGVKKFV
jgi:hypothetical protein